MKHLAGAAVLSIALFAGTLFAGTLFAGPAPARAGHGVVYYPSFYPQEIRIETIDPASAAALFENNSLHAYIGATPRFGGRVPDHLKSVESLDSFLVLTLNPASDAFQQPASRCAAARGILAALAEQPKDIIFNPYPVTPYHSDYLHHADRIEDAKAAVRAQGAIPLPVLKFQAIGRHAETLVQSRWALDSDDWNVRLEEVPVDQLMASAGIRLNGWVGPPWIKEGWFHAYRLLGSAIAEPEKKRIADALHGRLVRGEYLDLTERLNLERDLTAALAGNCDRLVVGYTTRREYYNGEFSAGVENIAFDAHLGLNSAVFVRTVKLKDFPWNGWLRLGINERPEAAWNPIAGFTDGPGRLIWSTLGDPALLPLPYNAGWIPNRIDPKVSTAKGQSGGFPVPAGAVIPEPGTGMLQPVGEGRFSSAKVIYRVLASQFHDGTAMAVADLLYPYVLAYRWGVRAGRDDNTYDPAIEATTALIRERLAGVRVVRVEREINEIAPDIKVPKQVPVIEVYVDYVSSDSRQVAALAPPWSPVPWQLVVLMEEAVKRGFAAFSKAEAARRGVGWLDLVRDPSLKEKLRGLIEEFAREGYRPAALKDLVTAEAARSRWRALEAFAEGAGHFLVTNGPYRLREWSQDLSVFQVVRELTYPVGIGTFNRYADPPRAVITQVRRDAHRVAVEADVEKPVKRQRTLAAVRERLKPGAMKGLYLIQAESRYLVVGPDGSVVAAGAARLAKDGRFMVDLPGPLPPGRNTFLVGVYLDGNSVNPAVRIFHFQANGS
ncbi:MAG: hypothetical protein ACE5KF_07820 [Kiloniellaceae bacterium]